MKAYPYRRRDPKLATVKGVRPKALPPLRFPPPRAKAASASPKAAGSLPVLDVSTADPKFTLRVDEIVLRIVALAQYMRERVFYPYQVDLACRVVESVLLHDTETVTALTARQCGKTEVIGATVAAMCVILPQLARQFPKDWHLNLTDSRGIYRGFRHGFRAGIYAPRKDQATIMFDRTKQTLETDSSKQLLRQLGCSLEEFNGNTIRLSNGSRALCESASEQSKIEGETHQLLVVEEAQDISDLKLRKSLRPMVAATGGSTVMVGTASVRKCDFYLTIRHNQRMAAINPAAPKNHFFFPYTVAVKYNSLYGKIIEKERERLGAESDEFRMSYAGEWIFERGMFVSQPQLLHPQLAHVTGPWAHRYPRGLPDAFRNYSIVVGIDWGSASDSTVLTFTAVDWDNPLQSGETYQNGQLHSFTHYRKHLVEWVEFIGDNYEVQFGNVMELLTTYPNVRRVVTDSNTCGLPIYHRLVASLADTDIEVQDFNFSAKLKSDGYKALYGDICARRATIPAGANSRRSKEYQRFIQQSLDALKEHRNGLMLVHHPDEKGAKDDYLDSWMLSAWGAANAANSRTVDMSDENPFYTRRPNPNESVKARIRRVEPDGMAATSTVARANRN